MPAHARRWTWAQCTTSYCPHMLTTPWVLASTTGSSTTCAASTAPRPPGDSASSFLAPAMIIRQWSYPQRLAISTRKFQRPCSDLCGCSIVACCRHQAGCSRTYIEAPQLWRENLHIHWTRSAACGKQTRLNRDFTNMALKNVLVLRWQKRYKGA